jgi:hypothetical protein
VHAAPLLDCGVGHVICWETPVPDSEAVIFGETLIDEFVKTKKVETVGAFQKAHSKATAEGSTAWALAPGQTSPRNGTATRRIKRELSDASLNNHSLPGPVPIKRELSTQSNLSNREASTPQAPKRKFSSRSLSSASQPKKRGLKRRLTDEMAISSLTEKRRRKLCKQPPGRRHSNTFNDEAIAQAMQESSQEQPDSPSDEAIAQAMQESSQELLRQDSPSDFAIAQALQAEEAGQEGCTLM